MSWWKAPEDRKEAEEQGQGSKSGATNEENPMHLPGSKRPKIRLKSQYSDPQGVPKKIHIYGIGSVGKFIAHSLAGIPEAPQVTLIWHKRALMREWKASEKKLTVNTKGTPIHRYGFEAELALPIPRFHKQEVIPGRRHPLTLKQIKELREKQEEVQDTGFAEQHHPETDGSLAEDPGIHPAEELGATEEQTAEPIHSLILCVKATNVVSAVSALRHRLTPESTILFVQNGLGAIDEVNQHVFPDPATRPSYLQGILSHGLTGDGTFECTHAGFGTFSIGPTMSAPDMVDDANKSTDPLDTNTTLVLPPTSRYLLRTILRTPVLTAAAYPPSSLFLLQLEKLAINSVINPLTSLLDCRNGNLLYSFPVTRLARLILSEVSMVLRSLPEIQGLPNVQNRFSPGRLETLCVGVAHRTAENISSMLADIRSGRRTEVDYINGWIVKRGEQLGVMPVVNYTMLNAVKSKSNMVQIEKSEELPFIGKVGRPGYEDLSGWEKAIRE